MFFLQLITIEEPEEGAVVKVICPVYCVYPASVDLIISKVNEVYCKIECEKGLAKELSEYFTFFVPGYQFVPAYRNRIWDGKIRLFNRQTNELYLGLIPYLKEFCDEREYTYEVEELEDEFSIYQEIGRAHV